MRNTTDSVDHSFSISNGYSVYHFDGRWPSERAILEASSRESIAFEYNFDLGVTSDEERWHFVFELVDYTETVRDERDGSYARLTSVWAFDDDEEVVSIAVNGGTRVPESALDAIRERPEVDGIDRPPYIPERDLNE